MVATNVADRQSCSICQVPPGGTVAASRCARAQRRRIQNAPGLTPGRTTGSRRRDARGGPGPPPGRRPAPPSLRCRCRNACRRYCSVQKWASSRCAAGIWVGQEDVMEVDDDARGEQRQHVEHDPVDVAADLDRVRGVHEEHVAVAERRGTRRRARLAHAAGVTGHSAAGGGERIRVVGVQGVRRIDTARARAPRG